MLVGTKILTQWATVACDIAPACNGSQSVGPVNTSLHSLIHPGLVDESSLSKKGGIIVFCWMAACDGSMLIGGFAHLSLSRSFA